jgi:hypothetical protein
MSEEFKMHVTDQNLIVMRGKSRTDYAIFLGSDNQDYFRPAGSQFVPIIGSGYEKNRREKTTARGEQHVYPHRQHDLPKHLQTV